MLIVDRETGIRCRTKVASYNLFVGVWYKREYAVPHIPIRRGDVVLDIGANQGFFACLAAHLGARVYAFEPDPESFERLLSNVELNGFSESVVAKPWAISDHAGSADLLVSKELGGAMSTIVPGFSEKTGMHLARTVSVPCHTLSEVFDLFSLSRVRLCKMDVEGSELAILRSLSPAHISTTDSFAMEVHPQAYPVQELLGLLSAWGTHQISFNDQDEFAAPIIRLTSTRTLLNEFMGEHD
ncbi:MAG: FkbM family methyltransferase [Candidatus Acidiferrales bacterium]